MIIGIDINELGNPFHRDSDGRKTWTRLQGDRIELTGIQECLNDDGTITRRRVVHWFNSMSDAICNTRITQFVVSGSFWLRRGSRRYLIKRIR
jgi:hypothetical protein